MFLWIYLSVILSGHIEMETLSSEWACTIDYCACSCAENCSKQNYSDKFDNCSMKNVKTCIGKCQYHCFHSEIHTR